MDAAVIVALVTSAGALLTAAFGWWVQRRQGLPSSFALTIRQELETANKTLTGKADRLVAELQAEKDARAHDQEECERRINRLTEAIVDRDLQLEEMRRRLGMPTPQSIVDPRG